nr:DUF3344 domain-containing protein [uncultured Methanoregula sp.]
MPVSGQRECRWKAAAPVFLCSLFLCLLLLAVPVTAAAADLSIPGTVATVPPSVVFAKEPNTIKINTVRNTGTETVTNITVALYASDVSGGTTPVSSTVISSLTGGGASSVTLIDPTLRNLEGGTVTYRAVVDPENFVAETDETNNFKNSSSLPVRYNGYKGKGLYWDGGSNITTKMTYDLNGGVVYSTQPSDMYQAVGWKSRAETWTASDLPVPDGATVEKVYLYVSYNWDTTPGGTPSWTANFNGNSLTGGTRYTDRSNFGSYPNNLYGLYRFDVTSIFSTSGNNLVITPGTGNSNALYPSTLVVIYRDPSGTRKQIFINEECDELLVSETYGTTLEEATAYAPFTGLIIDTGVVRSATLYSFAGSAGPDEGNLVFNGHTMGTNAWQGDQYSAGAQIFDVKSYLAPAGNEAAVQGTSSGGMAALQQILVIDYKPSTSGEPVASFTSNVTSGIRPLTVRFEDLSAGSPTAWKWDFGDNSTATEQNPSHVYTSAGTYTVSLNVTNAQGSNTLTRSSFITARIPSVAASFTANKTSGDAPMTVSFSDTSTGEPESWSWDFGDGTNTTGQNPVHTYSSYGTYTVKLTTANSAGSSTATITISVNVRTIVDQSFAIANLTTTQAGTGQNVSVSKANATVSGKTVTMTGVGHGWETLDILLTDLPESDGASVSGTVASVVAAGTPVTVPITDVGTPAINYTLRLQEVPNSSAQITMTITKDPDTASQSSFTLAATGAGKQMDAIAYTVNFNKTCLANHGENGSILNATIGMAVSPVWVTAHGGRDHIVIMRRADNGTTQFLTTQYQGTDKSGNELFSALSPDGLSTFILSSVSASSSGSGSSGGSSSSGGGGSSGGGSKLSSSAKEGQVYEYRSPSATSYAWVEKTTVADKGTVEILPLTADIGTMPEIEAKWSTEIPTKPDGGGRFTTSIVQALPGETRSLYRSALARQGLDIGTVAYSMVVNEEGIPQTKNAIIEMSVPQEWVKQNGGITQVKILRMDDEAGVNVLETAFRRYDSDSRYIVFRAKSPDGLCTFTLVSVTAGPVIVQQAPPVEPVAQLTTQGSAVLAPVAVAAGTSYVWIVAAIAVVVIACIAGAVIKKRRRQREIW